jgi:hypothetical protein
MTHNLLNTKGTQWLHFSMQSPLRAISFFYAVSTACHFIFLCSLHCVPFHFSMQSPLLAISFFFVVSTACHFIFLCSLHYMLFHSLSRGHFPSRPLQPLQYPLVSPLGVPDRSGTVCYRTDAVHELPSAPVHLLYWQTCITVLNFHSPMNFHGFRPFTA